MDKRWLHLARIGFALLTVIALGYQLIHLHHTKPDFRTANFFSLIRGPIVDCYPYPFLNPDAAGGYGAVALYCVAIALGIGMFEAIVAALSKRGVVLA